MATDLPPPVSVRHGRHGHVTIATALLGGPFITLVPDEWAALLVITAAADRDRLRSCQRVALARMRLAEAAGHPDPDGVISSLRAVLEAIDGE